MGKARSILGLPFLALSLAANTQSAPVRPHADLSQAIDNAVSKKGLPSVVVVLFDERRILWSHLAGYADIASKRVPTLNTRYRLGSTAKAMTSTVLAVAATKGLISFESPASVSTAQATIRIPLHQAVNMEAGLAQAVCYQEIDGHFDPSCGPGFDRRFALALTAGNARYSYSNMGPQVAADSLAFKSRTSFEQIARKIVFGPAGMSQTTYDHSRPTRDRATAYDQEGKVFDHEFTIMPAAGAGLEASAHDLVRFGQLHLAGRVPRGALLLPAHALVMLHSAPNDGFYGYGWGRIGAGKPTEVLIADGQVNGGQAMLILSPYRKVGAVVLSNAAHDEVSELAIAAIDAIAPGTAAAFSTDVATAQAAHEAKVSAFLPPSDFYGVGFIKVNHNRLPLAVKSTGNHLTTTLAGETTEQAESSTDEGFRGWSIPCPKQVPACGRRGAAAKIWLSRDADGLGGQLQVKSSDGSEFPYVLRLQLH